MLPRGCRTDPPPASRMFRRPQLHAGPPQEQEPEADQSSHIPVTWVFPGAPAADSGLRPVPSPSPQTSTLGRAAARWEGHLAQKDRSRRRHIEATEARLWPPGVWPAPRSRTPARPLLGALLSSLPELPTDSKHRVLDRLCPGHSLSPQSPSPLSSSKWLPARKLPAIPARSGVLKPTSPFLVL